VVGKSNTICAYFKQLQNPELFIMLSFPFIQPAKNSFDTSKSIFKERIKLLLVKTNFSLKSTHKTVAFRVMQMLLLTFEIFSPRIFAEKLHFVTVILFNFAIRKVTF
jgi:hypothetical protein